MTGVLDKAPIERLPGVSGRGTGHLLITFRLCRAERLYGNIWLHTVFSCTAAAAGADADVGAATAGAAAAVPGSPLVSRTRAHLRSSSWISGNVWTGVVG